MDKSMQTADHLNTLAINCGRGQVVELFACRNKTTTKFYKFGAYSHGGIYTVCTNISAEFQPTWFTREEVNTIRKNFPNSEDYYRGVNMVNLEWVRFSLSESPETL